MNDKHQIKKGDFITRNNKQGSFMIFEGNNISEYDTYKRLTLICEYDPSKYMMTAIGYDHVPNLEVATKLTRCSTTVDTDVEDYWVSLCTPLQKAQAEKILLDYGYVWKEDEMALIDVNTGEVVRRITVPDNKYHGEVIKPIKTKFKDMLKTFCKEKNKPFYPSYNANYDYYDD